MGRVLEGSPSDGVLMTGDLITAIDGVAIASPADLIEAIADAGSGTTITRGGADQDVQIIVGERKVDVPAARIYRSNKTYPTMPIFPAFDHDLLGLLPHIGDKIVSGVLVFEDEDGSFKTYRAVTGTSSNIDPAAGTFRLSPKDGSDPIDYTINDETMVNMSRSGDLGGINTTDETTVVDIDGDVKYVHQGSRSGPAGGLFNGGKGQGFRGPGAIPGLPGGLGGFTFEKHSWDDFEIPEAILEIIEAIRAEHSENGM